MYLSSKGTLFSKKCESPDDDNRLRRESESNFRSISTHKQTKESLLKNSGKTKTDCSEEPKLKSTSKMTTVNEYIVPNFAFELAGVSKSSKLDESKTNPKVTHNRVVSTKTSRLVQQDPRNHHKFKRRKLECDRIRHRESKSEDDVMNDGETSTIAIDDMGSQIFRLRVELDQESILFQPEKWQNNAVPRINRYQDNLPRLNSLEEAAAIKSQRNVFRNGNRNSIKHARSIAAVDGEKSLKQINKPELKVHPLNYDKSNDLLKSTTTARSDQSAMRLRKHYSQSVGLKPGKNSAIFNEVGNNCISGTKCEDKRTVSADLKSTNERKESTSCGGILTNPEGNNSVAPINKLEPQSITLSCIRKSDNSLSTLNQSENHEESENSGIDNAFEKLNIPGQVGGEDDLASVSFGVRERLRSWRHDLDIRTKKVKQHIMTTTLEPEEDKDSVISDAEKPNDLLKQVEKTNEPEEEPVSKSFRQRIRERFVFPDHFNDQSRLYLGWLTVVSLAFLYNAYSIPLRASFPYQTPQNLGYWLFCDYFCDLIYIIDMSVFKPRVMIIKNGMTITDRRRMTRHYLFSKTFKLDLLSMAPLDLFYAFPSLRWNPLLRLPRLLRLKTYQDVFLGIDSMIQNPYLLRITRMLTYMVYLIHCNSCIYYAFSEWEGLNSNTWVYSGEGNAYVRCFYFMLKVATSIGNNQSPTNVFEVLYMTYSWMLGVFVFALLLGQIRDIVATASKAQDHYRQTIDAALQDMKAMKLPAQCQEKVLMWFTHTWQEQKTFDERSLTDKLPIKLQTDLALSVHYYTLSKVELFKDCEPGLIRDLVLKLKAVLFLPGDYVCRKGEVGKEMYIVSKGKVQVVGGQPEVVFVTLSEGAVFGEIALLSVGAGNRRTADVKAKGFSTLFILEKNDLNEVIEEYPEAQKIMKRKAKQMMKNSKSGGASGDAKEDQIDLEKEAAKVHANRMPRMLETVVAAMDPGKETTEALKNLLKNYEKK